MKKLRKYLIIIVLSIGAIFLICKGCELWLHPKSEHSLYSVTIHLANKETIIETNIQKINERTSTLDLYTDMFGDPQKMHTYRLDQIVTYSQTQTGLWYCPLCDTNKVQDNPLVRD